MKTGYLKRMKINNTKVLVNIHEQTIQNGNLCIKNKKTTTKNVTNKQWETPTSENQYF